MQTAINGGGGLMNTLRKSYSVGDVTDSRATLRAGGVVLQELDENAGAQQQKRRLPAQLTPLQDVSDSEFEEIGEEMVEGNKQSRRLAISVGRSITG